jgi:hypothetical protein
MTHARFAVGCSTLFGLALLSGHARALCKDTAAATSATDLLMTPNNPCGVTGITDAARSSWSGTIIDDYDMIDDDWSNRGEATCNPSFGQQGMSTEVAKFFNAAELMVNGIQFTRNPGFTFGQSFHGSSLDDSPQGDYGVLSISSGNAFHDPLTENIVDVLTVPKGTEFAEFDSSSLPGQSFGYIFTSCAMYDNPFEFSNGTRLASTDPVFRAATVIHEAWHAWESNYGATINTSCGHSYCPGDHGPPPAPGKTPPPNIVSPTSCNPNAECDIWYPHPQGACPTPSGSGIFGGPGAECQQFGDEGYMFALMHRPYQAETEFSCDIANTPQSWVPLIVRELAASNADFYETNDSANGTDPTLPATQPACYSMDFGIQYATCGNGANQCDEANPCATGSFCNPQSGCCQSSPVTCSVSGRTTCNSSCTCDETTSCCVPAVL